MSVSVYNVLRLVKQFYPKLVDPQIDLAPDIGWFKYGAQGSRAVFAFMVQQGTSDELLASWLCQHLKEAGVRP
jgi:hypothetical protein